MKTLSITLFIVMSTMLSALGFNISGVAIDSETGNPITNIELGLEVPGTYKFTTTGSDGSFTFSNLSNGIFLLYYWNSDFINGSYYLHQNYGEVVINGADITGITFEIDPHHPVYEITGTIYDAATGLPVNNLNYAFNIEWDDHPEQWDIFVPNADGSFTIPGLPDWSYSLEWFGNNDYEASVTPATILKSGPQQVEVDIYLTPKSGPFISGVVLDYDTQEPIEMAGRSLILSDLPASHFTETDENGAFIFNGLEPGSYYKLEITTEDTAYINGEGSIVYYLTVPQNGLTGVQIYQHKFETVHEVTANTEEFTPGETKVIDFTVVYDDPVYNEIWGVKLILPDGVTAVSTPSFVNNSGISTFSRQYQCSSSSQLVWEGYHQTFYGAPAGNLEVLNEEASSAVSLHFDESLAGQSVEIGYEIYYTYTCVLNYFSYGSITLEDGTSSFSGPGIVSGFIRDAQTNVSIDNVVIKTVSNMYQASVNETPFGAHYSLGLPAGVYSVICEAKGYESQILSGVNIENGQKMTHTFYLDPVASKQDLTTVEAKQDQYLKSETLSNGVSSAETFIQLYPNPATNYLKVNSNEVVSQVKILNRSGQVVKDLQTYSPTSEIDISDLTAGLYFVNVMTNQGAEVKKLIVR
ncbi:MAG: T9SS type A sorting domain-containing protein [Bacteroidales bacterium]|nr:T9SS type A sorting domain-containing protein [Bacteroidales bacterium]